MDGQNHILAVTPLKLLPVKEFENRQKSVGNNVDTTSTLRLMKSMETTKIEVFAKKQKAKELKEKGNTSFAKKRYDEAHRFYSEAIELNIGSRPLWTNRAACRHTMKKYEEAISDCDKALSIDPKCTRSIIQKGNALLSLNRFDGAKECYESLRTLGESTSANTHLQKLHDIQDKISYFSTDFHHSLNYIKHIESRRSFRNRLKYHKEPEKSRNVAENKHAFAYNTY